MNRLAPITQPMPPAGDQKRRPHQQPAVFEIIPKLQEHPLPRAASMMLAMRLARPQVTACISRCPQYSAKLPKTNPPTDQAAAVASDCQLMEFSLRKNCRSSRADLAWQPATSSVPATAETENTRINALACGERHQVGFRRADDVCLSVSLVWSTWFAIAHKSR